MAGNNFTKGIGRLATDRYDFQHHVDGYSFKHKASIIDLSPSLTINGGPVTNVQSALAATSAELAVLELSGKGFITVGDGFDTYHFSNPADPAYTGINPDPAYDSTVPAFDTYLNNLLNISDPLNINYNPLHARIRDGGVILIKAGTYKFTGSVNVPPGFIIMGEGYGTRIVNQCLVPTPLFIIIPDPINSRVPDAAVDTNKFIFNRETIFINIAISDNFPIPKFTGDTSYLNPINNDSITPLILMKAGTSFKCDNVKFSGRALSPPNFTSFAIMLDVTIPTTTGTYLKINDCFIDGFAQPISFNSVGGRNDYLEVTNCQIRSHGYLNADGATEEFNCIIHMNDNNVVINNNVFYGNHDGLSQICYVKDNITTSVLAPVPAAGDLSSIVITANEFVVGKGDVVVISGDIIIVDPAILGTFNQYAFILAYGNNAAGGFSIIQAGDTSAVFYADTNAISASSATITLAASGALTLNGNTSVNINTVGSGPINISGGNILTNANNMVFVPNHSFIINAAIYNSRFFTVTTTPYTVDVTNASIPDYIILVDTSTLAITINLPAHSLGRTLIIKDAKGNASINNITLVRNGGTGNIDDFAGNRIISTNWISLNLISDGSNWLII